MSSRAREPAKYAYYDPALVPAPFGLTNGGATCWFNSLIQFLLGLPALSSFMLDQSQEFSAANMFADSYYQLVSAAIATPANDQNPVVGETPAFPSIGYLLGLFIASVKRRNPNFTLGYSQECVNEAYIAMIDVFNHPGIERLFTVMYRA